MQADDRARLVDILESSGEAVLYAGSRSGPELEVDRMRLLAVVRLLDVIGETAGGVSAESSRVAVAGNDCNAQSAHSRLPGCLGRRCCCATGCLSSVA